MSVPLETLLPELSDQDESLQEIASSPLLELPNLELPRLPRPRLRLPRPRLRLPRPRLRVPAELLEDGALLAGLASIAAGAGWIYPPAAAIVGGGFLVWLGLRAASRPADDPQLREPTQVVEQYVFGDLEED